MKLTKKQIESIKKHYKLSPREIEIVNLIFNGCTSDKQISMLLKINIRTTKLHLYHIFLKMDVHSKLEAVLKVLDHIF